MNIGYESRETGEIHGITFYEVSGEDVVKIDPGSDEEHNPILEKWLSGDNGNQLVDGIIIISPSYVDEDDENDLLEISESIHDFFGYLESKSIGVPICFIISKWDRKELENINLIDFINEHYKDFAQEISKNPESELMSFSIGNIEYKENTIESLDFNKGVSQVFEWIKYI